MEALFCAAQDIWWLIVTVGGIFAWVSMQAVKHHTLMKRIDYLEKRTKNERDDISMLLRAQFATLDGLKQLNCNGAVKSMYEEMRKYVLENH